MKEKVFALVIVVALLVPLRAVKAYDQAAAIAYVAAHANNPWSTMALAAVNAVSIPSDYLKTVSGTAAIDFEAPTLAITALGNDPRTFANEDLVTKIQSFHTGGQIGDATTLNDDIFGILALASAGVPTTDASVSDSKNFLLSHQSADGGWGFQVGGSSDSNTTATALVALRAAGVDANDTHLQSALTYLHTAQNDDGGFTYDPKSQYGTASDSSSTAWVLWALSSVNANMSTWTKNSHSPTEYLGANQNATGFVSYQHGGNEDSFSPVTTAYAVIALSGKTLPIKIVTPATGGGGNSSQFAFRIEGKDAQVCAGSTTGPTALDVVKNAATACGFTYHIKDTSFGPYLDQINNDTASGVIGWMYLVNYSSPDVGAADYVLHSGDTVLWYYGDFTWKPTRLSVDTTSVASAASTQGTVEYFDAGTWKMLSAANVRIGSTNVQTDSNGKATIQGPDGHYNVYARKDGYVRSNTVVVTIGSGSSNTSGTVALHTTITAGKVEGETLAFTVDTSSLDFGALKPGQSASKHVVVKNIGTTNFTLTGQVMGDPVFVDNIKLNNNPWSALSLGVASQAQTDVLTTLAIPAQYFGSSGNKSGVLTFWAHAQ